MALPGELDDFQLDALDSEAAEVYETQGVESAITQNVGNALAISHAVGEISDMLLTPRLNAAGVDKRQLLHRVVHSNNGILQVPALRPEQIDAMEQAGVKPIKIVELGPGPSSLLLGTPENGGPKVQFTPWIAQMPIGTYDYTSIELANGFHQTTQQRWETYRPIFDSIYGPEVAQRYYPDFIRGSFKNTSHPGIEPLVGNADFVIGVGTAQSHDNLKDYVETYLQYARPGATVMIFTFLKKPHVDLQSTTAMTIAALKLEGGGIDETTRRLKMDVANYRNLIILKNDPKYFMYALMRSSFREYDNTHWSPNEAEIARFIQLLQDHYKQTGEYDPSRRFDLDTSLMAYAATPIKVPGVTTAACIVFKVPQDKSVLSGMLDQAMQPGA